MNFTGRSNPVVPRTPNHVNGGSAGGASAKRCVEQGHGYAASSSTTPWSTRRSAVTSKLLGEVHRRAELRHRGAGDGGARRELRPALRHPDGQDRGPQDRGAAAAGLSRGAPRAAAVPRPGHAHRGRVAEPANLYLVEEIARLTGHDVQIVAVTKAEIASSLGAYLPAANVFVVDDIYEDIDDADFSVIEKQVADLADLQEVAGRSPVVKLVNYLIYSAVSGRRLGHPHRTR